MTVSAHLIRGWCPGALRPMRSGDGLLVRVRPRAGTFVNSALAVIAEAAARFGSGEIDLTNRGNLQLRGVSEDNHDAAIAMLRSAGLIDATAAIEAVRNIIVDPLSGVDPGRVDIRGLAVRFEGVLAADPRLWALPGKFGFCFSGSSELGVGGRTADIMIASQGDRFAIGLDGSFDLCAVVPEHALIDGVRKLALVFVDLAAGDPAFRRMNDAVARYGAAHIFAMAGLEVSPRFAEIEASAISAGLLARGGNVFGSGIGLPFGRITAGQLERLCQIAGAAKCDRVFTSPQRILVFPVAERANAELLLEAADEMNLITSSEDVRLRMDVCPGSRGCMNATTDTRRDAQRLVEQHSVALGGHSIHISGCEKGCARQASADVTLVARAGRYNLIRNGGPGDPIALADVEADDISDVISRFILEPTS